MRLFLVICVIFCLLFLQFGGAWKPASFKKVVGSASTKKPFDSALIRPGVLMGALAVPTSAMAADSSAMGAVSIPILISVLIMVPFLYYQQALRPKERSAKQIELDSNLKAKDKSNVSSGRAGEARAGKKR